MTGIVPRVPAPLVAAVVDIAAVDMLHLAKEGVAKVVVALFSLSSK
jgi:hypothetical protein